MKFNERLVAARKAKGISQEALGAALGISRQAVSKWETGESKPDLDNLIALCTQLNLNIEYLCLGQEETPRGTIEKPSSHPIRVLWTVGITLFSLLIGFLIGYMIPRETQPAISEEIPYVILSELSIVDASIDYDYEVGHFFISFMPSQIPEGIEVELLVENTNYPGEKTVSCVSDESGYAADPGELLPNCRYRATAIFTFEGQKKLIPIMEFSIDQDAGYEIVPLWG